MITWINPATVVNPITNLGTTTYPSATSFTYTFSATSDIPGATIVYELSDNVPDGITLSASGVLNYTSQYVSGNTTIGFNVSATEVYTASGRIQRVKNFIYVGIYIETLEWITSSDLGGWIAPSTLSIQLEATPGTLTDTLTYTLLNGNLPPGNVTLNSSGLLSGTVAGSNQNEYYTFTVRVTESGLTPNFKDRTFTILINGTNAPAFITSALPIFVEQTWAQFQFQWISYGDQLVTLSIVDGQLPAGLNLSTDGLITGYPGEVASETDYTFTVQLLVGGEAVFRTFTATVASSSTSRPTILNTRPLILPINQNDEYAQFYLSADGYIGEYVTDNNFIFKVIGYDFTGASLTYEFQGDLPTGLTFDASTGWITGTLMQLPVNEQIKTFYFGVTVYRTAAPSSRSDQIFFSITVTNGAFTDVTWQTAPDLGIIYNGTASSFKVTAENSSNIELSYRLVSSVIPGNISTIVKANDITGGKHFVFGDAAIAFSSTDSGSTWSKINSFPDDLVSVKAVVANDLTVGQAIVVLGQTLSSVNRLVYSTDLGTTWVEVDIPYSVAGTKFNNFDFDTVSGKYIFVGDFVIAYASALSSDVLLWEFHENLAFDSMNYVYINQDINLYPGFIFGGDNGKIALASRDASPVPDPNIIYPPFLITTAFSTSINSITRVNSTPIRYVAVGSLGSVLTSSFSAFTWTSSTIFSEYTYNSIVEIPTTGKYITSGTLGSIVTNRALPPSEIVSQSSGTFNTLNQIYIDDSDNVFIVGDGGVIIRTSLSEVQSNNWQNLTLPILPDNLELIPSGDIIGRLAFQSTDTIQPANNSIDYDFTVEAYNQQYPIVSAKQTFTLTTQQRFVQPWDTIYIKALMSDNDRQKITQLLALVPDSAVYRPEDINFGKAQSVIYQHLYGVPSVSVSEFYTQYLQAVTKNHYWRNITLGPIKTARASDAYGNTIYEVVYSEVIDNLINPEGISVEKQIFWPRTIPGIATRILYPNSLPNMREQIYDSIGQINDQSVLPLWMTTQQTNGSTLGYTQAWVICYTLAGQSEIVREQIETGWPYKLNEINFTIDRITVDRSLTYNYTGGDTWTSLPSAQPQPEPSDSQNSYVYFPQKTILPDA